MSMERKSKHKLACLFMLNVLLIIVQILIFVAYSLDYHEKLYDKNINDISNINQAAANISSEFLSSQESSFMGILRYLERHEMNMSEFLDYLDDTNSDETVSYQVVRSDFYGFCVACRQEGEYVAVNYTDEDYKELQSIFLTANEERSDIAFSAEFSDCVTGSKSFARYVSVPIINESGEDEIVTLMAVTRSAEFAKLLGIGSGYDKLSTVLVNSDGAYVLRNNGFKAQNFYEFLYNYNDISLEEMNKVKVLVNSEKHGTIRYSDSSGDDCVYVFSSVPNTDWHCITCVPIDSFRTLEVDITFTLLLVCVFIILFVMDLVYLLNLNRDLKTSIVHAEAANEAKTDFLSRMSHDIRTPINVIIGMTELALPENNPPATQESLTNIQASGKFLLGLVNDVLDMNKVESGKMELHPRNYTVRELKEYVNAVIVPLCEEKDIFFVINLDLQDRVLWIDGLRLNQIFFNLLSNAVKFTREGGHISLVGELELLSESHGILRFVVKDNGIGMSEVFQKTMFSAFTQEAKEEKQNGAGSGLGLAIVHNLVELMNGTIQVKSVENEGTSFSLAIPVTISSVAGKENSNLCVNGDLDGLHVLLCEDHPLNTKIVVKLLEKCGVIVDTAENGKIGTEMYASSEDGYYDAVLMDVRMPVMNGLDASREIRATKNRKDAAKIPIVALTANAYDSDVDECMEAGMNVHLAKPIDSKLLFSTLARVTGR